MKAAAEFNQHSSGGFFLGVMITLSTVGFVWFRTEPREDKEESPKQRTFSYNIGYQAPQLDLPVVPDSGAWLRIDPIPQTVPIGAITDEAPVPGASIPENSPKADAAIWVVMLAQDTSLANIEKIKRIFTRRNIQILVKNPGQIYLACVPCNSLESAKVEQEDWLRHPADLPRFSIMPQVVDLHKLAQHVEY